MEGWRKLWTVWTRSRCSSASLPRRSIPRINDKYGQNGGMSTSMSAPSGLAQAGLPYAYGQQHHHAPSVHRLSINTTSLRISSTNTRTNTHISNSSSSNNSNSHNLHRIRMLDMVPIMLVQADGVIMPLHQLRRRLTARIPHRRQPSSTILLLTIATDPILTMHQHQATAMLTGTVNWAWRGTTKRDSICLHLDEQMPPWRRSAT